MKLETKRLILRDYKKEDDKDLASALNNKNVARFMTGIPNPYNLKMAREFIERKIKASAESIKKEITLAICLKENNVVCGGVSLFGLDSYKRIGGIGYWLREDLWGKGYMSEAVFALSDLGFSKLKLRRIELTCNEHNAGSNAIAKKFGFKHEGVLRNASVTLHNKRVSNKNYYGLLKEEWPKVKRRLK